MGRPEERERWDWPVGGAVRTQAAFTKFIILQRAAHGAPEQLQ